MNPTEFWVATMNLGSQAWMNIRRRHKVLCRVYGDTDAELIGFQEFNPDYQAFLQGLRPEINFVMGIQPDEVDINLNPIGYYYDRFSPLFRETIFLSDNGEAKVSWDAYGIRAATCAKFKDATADKEFVLLNMHLDNKGEQARTESVGLIIAYLENNFPDLPTIITADSNTSVNSPLSELWTGEKREPYNLLLKAGYSDCWVETHEMDPTRPLTYHSFQGEDYRFNVDQYGTWDTEWIFVKGFQPLNCVLIRDNYGGTFPSDHYWMKAQLDYEP